MLGGFITTVQRPGDSVPGPFLFHQLTRPLKILRFTSRRDAWAHVSESQIHWSQPLQKWVAARWHQWQSWPGGGYPFKALEIHEWRRRLARLIFHIPSSMYRDCHTVTEC